MEMLNTKINQSWEIFLPAHRAAREQWSSELGWERERLQSIYEHVKEGDIFLYVGAECFDMCGLIAKFGAKLMCIEPNTLAYPNAKAIWESNNLEMPLVCFLGFAANENKYSPDSFDFINQLHFNRFPFCSYGEIIPALGFKELKDSDDIAKIKIDTLVEITGYIPNHISLDIEGSEGHALRGAEQTLRKYKPNIWLSGHPEFMVLGYNEYLGDLRHWIKQIGYKETLLAYSHELHLYYEAI